MFLNKNDQVAVDGVDILLFIAYCFAVLASLTFSILSIFFVPLEHPVGRALCAVVAILLFAIIRLYFVAQSRKKWRSSRDCIL